MGNVNAVSLPFLQREAQGLSFDAILHAGDFAYDLHQVEIAVSFKFFTSFKS